MISAQTHSTSRAPPPGALFIDTPRTEGDFAALVAPFRATGGAARGNDLARLLETLHLGDYMSLARLIVAGQVFGFHWRETLWVPMFQFELRDLSVRPGPQKVVAELAPVFDGWSIASWFSQPNCWLDAQRPIDVLGSDLRAVREAARTDRFVAAS